MDFIIGPISFYGAFALVGLYIFDNIIKRVSAWLKGRKGPKDKMFALICIFAAAGFALGSLIGPYLPS
jgi:hypothetical protein